MGGFLLRETAEAILLDINRTLMSWYGYFKDVRDGNAGQEFTSLGLFIGRKHS
jgi:hypothetical protein